MKTIEKIEKKGYKVIANMSYENGEQTIISYTATKGNVNIEEKNITKLFNRIK